jgi:ABC-type dipeptide/oligopeptide/nickel transport system permease component
MTMHVVVGLALGRRISIFTVAAALVIGIVIRLGIVTATNTFQPRGSNAYLAVGHRISIFTVAAGLVIAIVIRLGIVTATNTHQPRGSNACLGDESLWILHHAPIHDNIPVECIQCIDPAKQQQDSVAQHNISLRCTIQETSPSSSSSSCQC